MYANPFVQSAHRVRTRFVGLVQRASPGPRKNLWSVESAFWFKKVAMASSMLSTY